jgi:photosystem II stability/assembly factor-like uncharacterized protein
MKPFLLFLFTLLFSISAINSQWIEQTSGVTTQLTSVSAIDANNAWICGYSGVILRTTNGGLNWLSVTASPIPNTLNLHCIYGISNNTALVCGSGTETYVFRTSNAGVNWTQVFTEAGGFMNTILMGNSLLGFMSGDPVGGRWSLWGTINGGLTWDSTSFYIPQAGTEAGWNNSMFFDPSGGTVWFGTNNTRIYNTNNLQNWTAQTTTGQVNSYAVWFNNSTTGMTGGTGTLITTNAGTNWVATSSLLPGTANISGITGVSNSWWVIRQSTAIYYSPNNGVSWVTDYTAPAGNFRHISKARTGINIVLWAIRANGGISRIEIPVGIGKISQEIPEKFILMQNYPNPFNPSTNIRFDIPFADYVKLVVFDAIGREVSVLIDSRYEAGSYEVDFDGSRLTSGVYFYKLTTGEFFDSKKMILSK